MPHKRAEYSNDPKALFIYIYKSITPLLRENHLTIADFVAAVLYKRPVADDKMPTLQALLLAAGHNVLPNKRVNLDIIEMALLFAATLGNNDFVIEHLSAPHTLFRRPALQKAFLVSARNGHLVIFNYLFNRNYPISTLRQALREAAVHGQTAMVVQLLGAINPRLAMHTLRQVVTTAIVDNHPGILSLVLRDYQPGQYASEIRSSVIIAAGKNVDTIVAMAYQLAAVDFNDKTILEILKIAVAKGNKPLINLFISHPALLNSPATCLESIQIALGHKDEAIALLFLQKFRNQLKPYFKREILLMAIKEGFNSIVNDLLTDSNLKLTVQFFNNAIEVARLHHQPHTQALLSQHVENDLSHALGAMNIQDTPRSYTPAYRSRPVSYHSQTLDVRQKTTRNFMQ